MQDSRSATDAKMRLQGTHISPDCSGGIRIEYARNKSGDSVCIVVQYLRSASLSVCSGESAKPNTRVCGYAKHTHQNTAHPLHTSRWRVAAGQPTAGRLATAHCTEACKYFSGYLYSSSSWWTSFQFSSPSPMECSTYRHQATCYSILTLKKETQNLSFLNTFMLILLYFIVPFSVHIAYIIIICKQLVIYMLCKLYCMFRLD